MASSRHHRPATTPFSLPNDVKCGQIFSLNISSYEFDRGWEGIPANLIINSIIFASMILLFSAIRNNAWNRKSSQLTRTQKGWIQFIYGDRENRREPKRPIIYTDHHDHEHQKYNHLLLPPTAADMSVRHEINVNIETSVDMQCDLELENETHLSVQARRSTPGSSNSIKNDSSNGSNSNSSRPTSEQVNCDIGGGDDASTERRSRSFFDRSMSTTEIGYWLCDILCIKDRDILAKKGSDAVQYLIFQRYIIYFLTLLTFICMFIILPINLQGNTEPWNKPFGRTTVSNIGDNENLLWAHVVISILLLPVGIAFMCHFSKRIKADELRIVKRTLYVRRIPKSKRSKDGLASHLNQLFPDVVIEGIQFVYNTRRLKTLHLEYNNVANAKYYCEEYLNENHKRCDVYPYFMGHLGPYSCCGCDKVDGISYYEGREQELEREIEKEFRSCISDPSGSAFITFQNEKMAQKVYRALRKNQEESCTLFPCNCCFRLGTAIRKLFYQDSDEFETSRWLVGYAPYPDDINWDDIAVDYKLIWMRRIIVHLCLFVLFFFLSTPLIVLSYLSVLKIQETIQTGLYAVTPFAAEYLAPLLMVIAAIILPSFVILASQYLPYKTLSDLNHSIMWKVYLFLIMMVIILPSLGLTSASALLESLATKKFNKFNWECLFPVDNGAFFVNYVLQSTLLGNAMELLRFPELFLYFFYYMFSSKTPAEYENARQQVIFDFQFGIRYPRFLLIFCMVVTYSLSCPLIAPCGLLYMVVKHIVDRYNIYYVYTPSKINGRIHSTAITFFHIAILMMIFQIFTFCFLRTGQSGLTKVCLVLVIIATIIFSGHCFFHCFWNINHLTYNATTRRASKRTNLKEFCACSYLPPVLFDLNVNGIVPPESQTTRNYGSLTPSPSSVPMASSESSTRLNISSLTT
ncbi:CSC1-like protein 1 [Tetranychus urticae]|uniref:CSC1/OSCA1-like cytosolic domain-containing protein n=1 Tax=Tetranychus urticae TaxID=32264 RepID=T1KI80_TETUR|nr:CSC1-like protein 1 [Tetranychus urticae]